MTAFQLTVAGEADRAEWDSFAAAHPDAAGYHEWAWRSVFTGAFGHEPIYLIAREAGQVVGLLPLVYMNSFLFGRALISLPFLNYGGIVAASDGAADALLRFATELARDRDCRHIELRHKARRFQSLPCRQHKVTMLLPLEKGLWERLDRKVRNQVRKAQKSGLTVHSGQTELIGDFYTVFSRNMRDLGTPVYSPGLFEEVLRSFPGRATMHIVRLQDKPVAAGLTFRTKGTVEIPWASSIRDYNTLCPNHLLYWSILESAIADGCGEMDFGRSTPDEGTYKFKQQWGAQPVPLHWEYQLLAGDELPNASPTNSKFKLMIAVWKRLPLALATRVGPHIVRAIP
jgi:FemAB-related protein (PEP-CTERM system-associated)